MMKKVIDLLNEAVEMGFDREEALQDIDVALDGVYGEENRPALGEEEIPEKLYDDILSGFRDEKEAEVEEPERDVKILVADGCTESEARRHLAAGTTIFDLEDLNRNLDSYVDQWEYEGERKEAFAEMLRGGALMEDWGRVQDGDSTYLIMYVL